MDITGRIIVALEPRSGISKSSGTPWKMQEFVLETINEQYPHKMMFSVFGEDKIQQAAINVGDDVTVSFDVNAREYNGRWYNDIRAWRVSHEMAGNVQPNSSMNNNQIPVMDTFVPSNEKDDLPF